MVNFWKNAQSYTWVEPSECAVGQGKDVLFFRNRIGVGIKPAQTKVEESEKGDL